MIPLIRRCIFTLPLCVALAGCSKSRSTVARTDDGYSNGRSNTVAVDRNEGKPSYTRTDAPAADAQHDITLEQVREHVRKNTAVLIDARSPEQYSRSHVRGAINLPAGQVDAYIAKVMQAIPREQFIIVYCGGPTCHASDLVYERLAAQGYANVKVFSPGWQALSSSKNLLMSS